MLKLGRRPHFFLDASQGMELKQESETWQVDAIGNCFGALGVVLGRHPLNQQQKRNLLIARNSQKSRSRRLQVIAPKNTDSVLKKESNM